MHSFSGLVRLVFLSVIVCAGIPPAPAAEAAAVPFAAVQEIFDRHCLDCHAAEEPEGKLVLESFASLQKGGESGRALVPGQSSQSLLIQLVEGSLERDGKKKTMPPGKRKKLEPAEVTVLRRWIDAGAPAPEHDIARQPRERVIPKILPLRTPRGSVQALAYADGAHVLAVAKHGAVELRSSETREVLRTLSGAHGNVNAVAFSRDGAWLAGAAGEPGLSAEAILWRVQDGHLERTWHGHRDALYAIALSPDGATLATGSYDQKIKLWDIASGRELHTLTAHNGAIFSLAFRPDGKILASASGDRTVKLWQVGTGKRVETLSQALKEVNTAAFSPDGHRLVTAGADNRLRLYEISESAAETTNPLLDAKFAHEGTILHVAFSADGKVLASTADDRTIKLWNAADLSELRALPEQPEVAPALAFLEDVKALAVGRVDGSLEFYEVATGKPAMISAPEVTSIAPRGLQIGHAATFTLGGKHLGAVKKISGDQERITGELVGEGTGTNLSVRLTASPAVRRGPHEIELETAGGKARVTLYLEDLPQQFAPADATGSRRSPLSLPVSVWGAISKPGDVDEIPFAARRGERLVFDLAVKQVRSKMANAVLTVLDSQRRPLAVDLGFDGGDRWVTCEIPADGTYIVRVADQMLAASPEHIYRLNMGALPYVTAFFPMSVPTNTETTVELAGANLPAHASVRVQSGAAGELELPLDPMLFRAQRPFHVLVSEGFETLEREPNDTPADATPLPVPGAAEGRLEARAAGADVDLFRFETPAGKPWVIETIAAQRGSAADTKIEMLHPNGEPVARLQLQALRNSAVTFRGIDSLTTDCRTDNWEEMELNQYLYLEGEVVRILRMPQGPDSGFLFYAAASGRRRAWFDTTATAHALDSLCYIVEPRPLGTPALNNGLPVFPLFYANDDDGDRRLGRDSRLQFIAPTNGSYLVRVSDTRGWGGDRFPYRLVVRPAKPDFKLTLREKNPTVPRGSGQSFTIVAERFDEFEGEIRVEIDGLPPGFAAATPLVIQAGHTEAKGTLFATENAPPLEGEAATRTRLRVTASLNGEKIARDMEGFGVIKLGPKPRLFVSLLPVSTGSGAGGSQTNDAVPEIVLAPGQTLPAELRVQRNGHTELVTFFVENLPHGVIVADIGLNGVLIPKDENERQIFLSAAKWVPETDRYCYAIENQAGRQTSRPVLLKVRRPKP